VSASRVTGSVSAEAARSGSVKNGASRSRRGWWRRWSALQAPPFGPAVGRSLSRRGSLTRPRWRSGSGPTDPGADSRAMFDPDNILPVALEELVICEGDDVTDYDRLHCDDTIGPCAACPRLGDASGAGDEAS
jgi:hypothetical protein